LHIIERGTDTKDFEWTLKRKNYLPLVCFVKGSLNKYAELSRRREPRAAEKKGEHSGRKFRGEVIRAWRGAPKGGEG